MHSNTVLYLPFQMLLPIMGLWIAFSEAEGSHERTRRAVWMNWSRGWRPRSPPKKCFAEPGAPSRETHHIPCQAPGRDDGFSVARASCLCTSGRGASNRDKARPRWPRDARARRPRHEEHQRQAVLDAATRNSMLALPQSRRVPRRFVGFPFAFPEGYPYNTGVSRGTIVFWQMGRSTE